MFLSYWVVPGVMNCDDYNYKCEADDEECNVQVLTVRTMAGVATMAVLEEVISV